MFCNIMIKFCVQLRLRVIIKIKMSRANVSIFFHTLGQMTQSTLLNNVCLFVLGLGVDVGREAHSRTLVPLPDNRNCTYRELNQD